jgi:hypothetical protein
MTFCLFGVRWMNQICYSKRMIRQEFFAQRTIRWCLLSNVRLRTLLRNLRRMHGPQQSRRQDRVAATSWFRNKKGCYQKSSLAGRFAAWRHPKRGPTRMLEFWSLKANRNSQSVFYFGWAQVHPIIILAILLHLESITRGSTTDQSIWARATRRQYSVLTNSLEEKRKRKDKH